MEHRRLGRTGHHSSVAVLGGAAFWQCTEAEAAEGLGLALDRGVNHLDIAPGYGDAELVVGPHIPAVRDRLFIGEKTRRRNPDGVRAQLTETLRRLGTDHVDLYQLHAVTGLDELDRCSDAVEVLFEARAAGLTRFVGITGHDLGAPVAHLEALRRWDLDTVMFPVYPRVLADEGYRGAVEALLAECSARDVGVMAIKAVAHEPWDRGAPRTAGTWYRPYVEPAEVVRGVRFALSTPGVHAMCTPGDLGLLPVVLDAAEGFRPLAEAERLAAMAAMRDDELIFPLAETAVR